MRRVAVFQTADGYLHLNKRDADRHAEKIYGDKLLSLSRSLAQQKYSFVSEFIDANIDQFAELQRLKDDRVLGEGDDDD